MLAPMPLMSSSGGPVPITATRRRVVPTRTQRMGGSQVGGGGALALLDSRLLVVTPAPFPPVRH